MAKKILNFSPEQIQTSSILPIIVKSATRFKTNYSTEFKTNGVGLDIIEQSIKNFYDTFYGIDEQGRPRYPAEVYDEAGNVTAERLKEHDWFVNGKPNWNVLKDKVEVRIMSKKHRTKVVESNPAFNFVLDGVPYLVIKEARQKGAPAGSIPKPIYIQFQPKQLAEDSPYLQPIRELVPELEAIQTILGDAYALSADLLDEAVKKYALTNFVLHATPATETTSGKVKRQLKKRVDFTSATTLLGITLPTETAERLDTAFSKVVELTYGIDKKIVTFNNEKEALDFLAANAQKNEDGTWTLTSQDISSDTNLPKTYLIVKIEEYGKDKKVKLKYAPSLENVDKLQDFYDYGVVKGQGPASHKFNAIAMANKDVSGIPIRITTVTGEGGKTVKFTRAKSIFSSSQAFDLTGFLEDTRVVDAG